jgi:hypothetical protein
MGKALNVVSCRATAPGVAAFAAGTYNSGDSGAVRNAAQGSNIQLIEAWQNNNAAGFGRIRSPRLHDNVSGIHFVVPASQPQPVLGRPFNQKLYSQDVLINELEGSAVGGQIEVQAMLIYYEDLPGCSGVFIDNAFLLDRMVNIVTVQTTQAFGATGDYTGQTAINATDDQLKANTWYAILGHIVSGRCALVGVRGPDTGQIRFGCPGDVANPLLTRSWYQDLSFRYGMPLIPCINAANKGATFVDGVQDQAAGAVTTTTILAELGGGSLPIPGSGR